MNKPTSFRPRHRSSNAGRCSEAMRTPQLVALGKAIAAHKEGENLLNLANAIAGVALPGPWSIRVKYSSRSKGGKK